MKHMKNNLKDLLQSNYPNIDGNSLGSYCNKFEKIIKILNNLGVNAEEKKKSILSSVGKKDFLNYVCELSIIYHFATNYPNCFKNEVNSFGNKNYDFSFYKENLKINVEIKSLSPSDNSGKIPIKIFLPKEQEQELYNQGLENITRTTHKKIKELLEKANSQLPSLKDNEINVTILCVSDLDEYADVVTNLLHSEINLLHSNNFNKIDCILVCNIGFEHNFLLDKSVYETYIDIQSYKLNGEMIWEYKRSIPVLPMLFWLKTSFPRNDETQKNVMEAMFSHTCYLREKIKSNNDIQEAIFELYNNIAKGVLNNYSRLELENTKTSIKTHVQ
ncbi:hypothetical protein ACFGXS_04540 [Pasteurella multocida]